MFQGRGPGWWTFAQVCKVLDPGPSVPSPRALWGAHISSCMSGRMYLSRLCMYVTGFPISCTSRDLRSAMAITIAWLSQI